jgi:hypothetical protein
MAAAAESKQRTVPEILSAAFKSRDHNVLSAMMGVSARRGSTADVLLFLYCLAFAAADGCLERSPATWLSVSSSLKAGRPQACLPLGACRMAVWQLLKGLVQAVMPRIANALML